MKFYYSCSVTMWCWSSIYFDHISGRVHFDSVSQIVFNTIINLFRCPLNLFWPTLYLFRWSLSILTCCCSSNSQLLQHSRWLCSLVCPPLICSLTCAYKDTNVELHDCTNVASTLAHLYIRTSIQIYKHSWSSLTIKCTSHKSRLVLFFSYASSSTLHPRERVSE